MHFIMFCPPYGHFLCFFRASPTFHSPRPRSSHQAFPLKPASSQFSFLKARGLHRLNFVILRFWYQKCGQGWLPENCLLFFGFAPSSLRHVQKSSGALFSSQTAGLPDRCDAFQPNNRSKYSQVSQKLL